MFQRIQTIVGTILFGIFINVLGYQYLFADLEKPTQSAYVQLNPVSLYAGDDMDVDEAELHCLAQNIYHEARGQSEEGQFAVAFVTMNRVMHLSFPDTVCDVVFQPYQFSWTHQNVVIDRTNIIERQAWENSLRIALAVLIGDVYNDMYGITHYHATSVNPNWGYRLAMQIDDHKFFVTN